MSCIHIFMRVYLGVKLIFFYFFFVNGSEVDYLISLENGIILDLNTNICNIKSNFQMNNHNNNSIFTNNNCKNIKTLTVLVVC